MATVNKDFKVKNGLIVEGTTATVNNYDVLTKKTDDQNYIIGLIGGSSDSANTPNTVVKRDANGDFAAGEITADLVGNVTGNADTATALETSRTITLGGDLSGSVSFDGSANVTLTATVDGSFATDAEVATAKSEAISDAAADATSKANAAEANANDYTDAEIITALTTAQGYANTAESNANSYTDTAITNLDLANTYDALGSAAQALTDANAYTDGRETAITTAYQAYADQAETDAVISANAYADQKVADLVDAAPALLDTLNELAAAIGDDSDFIGTVTAAIGEKVAKAGDTMTGELVMSSNKITSLGAPTANGDAANKLYVDTAASTAESNANSYTDGEISTLDAAAQGYASTAQSNAETFATNAANTAESNAEAYADSLAVNYDPAGSAATAQSNANSYTDTAISGVNSTISALDTDDVAEGSNLYYTTSRAKTDAASLLTSATLTNIQITGDGNGLTITAENGVADSTTDDLSEGSSNLYFTDARAVSALEAVVPNFTAVEVNSVAKQVAASAEVATASTNTALSWLKADYRSAEFLVKIANGSHTDVSKVILTLDTSDNVAITEYAMVGTNGSLGSVSADVSGNDVRLRVTTANNTSTVAVIGTLLA